MTEPNAKRPCPGHSHPLMALVLARLLEFWREPAAIFWVYVFPLLLVIALGIAFRSQPAEKFAVVIAAGSKAAALEGILKEDKRFGNRLFVYVDTILNHDKMLELIGICDTVFHLAAAVGVEYILDHPMESIKTNIQGTEKVLELCNKFKKKALIASSEAGASKTISTDLDSWSAFTDWTPSTSETSI